MPRPPKRRKISFLPRLTYFKPAGVPLKKLKEVHIKVDELEALRLKDLEGLDQEACADKMGISRPTFHRIINAARSKITGALIEGSAIRLDRGNILEQITCSHCGENIKLTDHRHAYHFEVCPRRISFRCPFCHKNIDT